MEPNVTKAEFVMGTTQLISPIGAEGHRRVVAPDSVFPEMRQDARRCPKIALEPGDHHRLPVVQVIPPPIKYEAPTT